MAKPLSIRTINLEGCPAWKKPVVIAAAGFWLGCSPIAPGTFGTIPGILLVLLFSRFSLLLQLGVAALCLPLSIFLCGMAEKHFKVKDDPRIVADEYLTFPICMLGLPPEPWVLAMAFLSSRAMDILKPPPARRLQALPSGLGITIDDAISSVYSLAINHLLYWIILRAAF